MFLVVKNNKLKVNSKSLVKNILMTVFLSGMSSCAYQEYEPAPMASIIIGGMASSTILNLLIMPTVMLKIGKFKTASVEESFYV